MRGVFVIVITQNKILKVLIIIFLILLILNLMKIKKTEKIIQVVSLPVTGKTIVLDAGHGYPDERS